MRILTAFIPAVWCYSVLGAPASLPTPPLRQSATHILVEMAQSEDPATRLSGLRGLARTSATDHLSIFMEALCDEEPTIRTLAGRALANQNADALFDRILDVLLEGHEKTIVPLAKSLPMLSNALEPKAIAVLEAREESSVRKWAAAYCLGWMGSIRAIPALVRNTQSPDLDVAVSSANALFALRDPVVLPEIVALTAHPLAEVQSGAMVCLANIGGYEAIDALGSIALGVYPHDGTAVSDKALCRQAVSLLGQMGSPAAVPLLIDVMRHNLKARLAAAGALRKITGVDMGDMPSDWQEWYEREPDVPPLIPAEQSDLPTGLGLMVVP